MYLYCTLETHHSMLYILLSSMYLINERVRTKLIINLKTSLSGLYQYASVKNYTKFREVKEVVPLSITQIFTQKIHF